MIDGSPHRTTGEQRSLGVAVSDRNVSSTTQVIAPNGYTDGRPDTATKAPRTRSSLRVRRSLVIAGEVMASLAGALVPLQLATTIQVNPLDRIGQVSGLAAIQFQYAIAGMVLLAVVVVAARLRRRGVFPVVSALAFAAASGLATGIIGAGVMVALHGTVWPLNANMGDSGRIAEWAADVAAGGSPPPAYPPAFLHLMAWWSQWSGGTTSEALKTLQIGLTALFGPLAYLSWRLVLRPPWALGVGLVAALPLIDPYKPYTNVILVVLVPERVQLAAGRRRRRLPRPQRVGMVRRP